MSYDTPEAVLKLARQFMESRILLSAAEMNLFTRLEEEPSSAEDLAGRLHADLRGLTLLLDALAAKVFHALVSRGRIVIRDHVMEPDRTEPKDGAIFAVNMLVNTEGGSTYTCEEIRSWLEEAGFVNVRYLRRGEHMDSLVEAFKP